MEFKTKTAVVILNWNGIYFLEKFLEGVLNSLSGHDAMLIVADNASTDNSVEYIKSNYPDIGLILFDQNYGFTGGYNRALQQVDAEYYILLNSDVEVPANWLAPLVEYMDANPGTAACAPKLLAYHDKTLFEYAGAAGGFIDKYGYPFCRGRILQNIEKDNGQYNTNIDVFWATGAALMIRADLYHKAGGLDDSFFAHMEEIDLCWRLHLMGYKVANVPQSYVYHVGGGALPKESPRKLYLNYRNNLMMLAKNLQKGAFFTILMRLFLDGISALIYLFTGKFSSFIAVIKAHWTFFIRIPQCRKSKKQFKPLIKQKASIGMYKGSIVYRFFKSGKKLKFSDL